VMSTCAISLKFGVGSRLMKRPLFCIIAIAIVHFVASLAFLMLSFSDSMARFDTGEPRNMMGSVIYYTSELLTFPIVKIIEHTDLRFHSTVTQYIPFMVNSLVWGWFVVFILRRFRRAA